MCKRFNLVEPLRAFVSSGKYPVWGVCAGLIMLSDRVTGLAIDEHRDYQALIGGLNIDTHRNHFGRQSRSAIRTMELSSAARAAGLLGGTHHHVQPRLRDSQHVVDAPVQCDGTVCTGWRVRAVVVWLVARNGLAIAA